MAIHTKRENKRVIRHARVRAKISGTALRPRFSVFRSNKHIHAQLIDDEKGVTIAAASSVKMPHTPLTKMAHTVGTLLAKAAKGKGVTQVVFDRGGFLYTGVVKACAEGAREGGLTF